MTQNQPTSSLRTTTGIEVPLRGVKIDGKLTGATAEVTIAQRFANTETMPVEAVYVFPLESQAAVCKFRARVGERIIEGRVEEKETAFEIYDDALADGHGAMLLDQERPNIFTMSVGNLEPGSEVTIEITYVMKLETEGPALRLMIPTTVSPRYVPKSTGPEVGQPDGERVNPQHWPVVSYGFELALHVALGSSIKSVESPSHQIRTELEGDTATITLSRESAAMDRDFVLLVEPRAAFEPRALSASEADGTRVLMVEFVPDPDQRLEAKEVHFVVDCSGSMAGDSIDEATRALKLCLRQLEESDTFNVTAFGSTHETLWSGPKKVTSKNVETASHFLARGANMGGTEIYRPLAEILSAKVDATRPRQVVLLTDGQVSNEDQVIALCDQHRANVRVFAFGIGAGVSKHLVESTARATGGAAEFIYPGERIEPKVLRMFGRVATPALEDIEVDWGELSVEQAPAKIDSIFAGDPLTIFARVKGGQTDAVVLRASGFEARVEVDLEHANQGGPLPTLWAKQRIQDYEDGVAKVRRGSSQRRPGRDPEAELDKKLIDLSKRYGVVSRATSYVAVETRAEADKTTAESELRHVPVALTAGWGGQGSVVGRPRHPMMSQAPGGGGGPRYQASAPPPPAQAPAPMRPGRGYGADRPQFSAQAAMPEPEMAKQRSAPRSRSLMSKLAGGVSGLLSGAKKKETMAAAPFDSFDAMAMDDEADEAFAMEEGERELSAIPIVSRTDVDQLYDVLLLQTVKGSFELTPKLLDTIGANPAKANADAAIHGAEVVATKLVLAWLEQEHAPRRAEWREQARKAKKWLAKAR